MFARLDGLARALRLEAGDQVEQFRIDGALALAVKGLRQHLEVLGDILFGALHGRQACGVFAGQRAAFGARP